MLAKGQVHGVLWLRRLSANHSGTCRYDEDDGHCDSSFWIIAIPRAAVWAVCVLQTLEPVAVDGKPLMGMKGLRRGGKRRRAGGPCRTRYRWRCGDRGMRQADMPFHADKGVDLLKLQRNRSEKAWLHRGRPGTPRCLRLRWRSSSRYRWSNRW